MFEIQSWDTCSATISSTRAYPALVGFIQVLFQTLVTLSQSLSRYWWCMWCGSRCRLIAADNIHCGKSEIVHLVLVVVVMGLTQWKERSVFIKVLLILLDLGWIILLVVYRSPDLSQHATCGPLAINLSIRLRLHANDSWRLRHSQIRSPIEATSWPVFLLSLLLFFSVASIFKPEGVREAAIGLLLGDKTFLSLHVPLIGLHLQLQCLASSSRWAPCTPLWAIATSTLHTVQLGGGFGGAAEEHIRHFKGRVLHVLTILRGSWMWLRFGIE